MYWNKATASFIKSLLGGSFFCTRISPACFATFPVKIDTFEGKNCWFLHVSRQIFPALPFATWGNAEQDTTNDPKTDGKREETSSFR